MLKACLKWLKVYFFYWSWSQSRQKKTGAGKTQTGSATLPLRTFLLCCRLEQLSPADPTLAPVSGQTSQKGAGDDAALHKDQPTALHKTCITEV